MDIPRTLPKLHFYRIHVANSFPTQALIQWSEVGNSHRQFQYMARLRAECKYQSYDWRLTRTGKFQHSKSTLHLSISESPCTWGQLDLRSEEFSAIKISKLVEIIHHDSSTRWTLRSFHTRSCSCSITSLQWLVWNILKSSANRILLGVHWLNWRRDYLGTLADERRRGQFRCNCRTSKSGTPRNLA